MTNLTRIVDGGVGQTRELLLCDARPVSFSILRWSDAGRRARWGEAYVGRVRAIDGGRRGAYIDIGLPENVFLRLDAQRRAHFRDRQVPLIEGQAIEVEIVREAIQTKAAVVRLVNPNTGADVGELRSRPETDEDLRRAVAGSHDDQDALDAVEDLILSKTAPLPGGGMLTIEPTAALVAIDVDVGGRSGSSDPERLARSANIEAASEALRQLRLRNLGGLIAIDFISMRSPRSKADVLAAVKDSAGEDPWGMAVGGLSRFGVVELSRGQLRTPTHELFSGRNADEAAALRTLRAMERCSAGARGGTVVARVPPGVAAWLERDHIEWRSALRSRIGSAWRIDVSTATGARGVDVEVQ
jgi:ribonuclease E